MIKEPLTKVANNGQSYRLVFFDNNNQVIFKNSAVIGNEADFSIKVAEFNDEKKAIKYWNNIK